MTRDQKISTVENIIIQMSGSTADEIARAVVDRLAWPPGYPTPGNWDALFEPQNEGPDA